MASSKRRARSSSTIQQSERQRTLIFEITETKLDVVLEANVVGNGGADLVDLLGIVDNESLLRTVDKSVAERAHPLLIDDSILRYENK